MSILSRIFKRDTNLEPNDIFNPRGKYNAEMYVARPTYERSLSLSLSNDLCILVHGQSGTGKTWLTRNVLEKESFYYKIVNLAAASSHGSIYDCFKHSMNREGWRIKTKYVEGKATGLGISGFANANLSHSGEYSHTVDYFMEFLKFMKHSAGGKKKRYIVFENFESIIGKDKLIEELTNLIILTDDDEVAEYETKFIIIGATKDIHKYFSELPNINTIENRIYELPEVKTLSTLQSFELIDRGFKKLDVYFDKEDLLEKYKEELTRATGGIPQRLQELCLAVSQIFKENNWEAKEEFIEIAKKDWIKTSLNKNYVSMTKILKYDSLSDSRKNQVLYCVAQKDNISFDSAEVDEDLKAEFMGSTSDIRVASAKQLNELCNTNPQLLEKSKDTNEYSFVDFKYALCLRAMLYKKNEKVFKLDFDDV